MTDEFLVKFALATLVAISFAFQHGSQIAVRNLDFKRTKDKNFVIIVLILILQLSSIGIITEIISYALKK